MTEALSLPAAEAGPPEAGLPDAGQQLINTRLRAVIEADLLVESVIVPREAKQEGVLEIRGRLLRPSAEVFPRWLAALNAEGYTPLLRPAPAGAGDSETVIVRIMEGVARGEDTGRVRTNVILFVLTVISTLFVGAISSAPLVALNPSWEWIDPRFLITGAPFAATLLSILTAHEFGHYFAARYHKVAVTLPYFIPMPLTFGTLGAFIQLKQPIADRRKLFDIGVAGPLAGLVLAVPLLWYGLATSVVRLHTASDSNILEGNSILYYAAKLLIFGKVLPNFSTGEDVFLNQVASGAWIGLLVTALNLLPVGQLDGGHTVFAMFGERARIINRITVGALAFFAFASLPFVGNVLPWLNDVAYGGWFLWLFLILFLIGVEHPPALDDVTRLDRRRWWIGVLVIIIFVLIFVPVPMREL